MWGSFTVFTGVPAFKDKEVGITVFFKMPRIRQSQLLEGNEKSRGEYGSI